LTIKHRKKAPIYKKHTFLLLLDKKIHYFLDCYAGHWAPTVRLPIMEMMECPERASIFQLNRFHKRGGFRMLIHHRSNPVAGATTATFELFIAGLDLLQRLPAGGGMRTLLWDNLSSHLGNVTANMILPAGHRIVVRPAWNPQDGPIEYIFDQIQLYMQKRNMYTDDTVNEST
jgi:hypothetical protein